MLAVLPAIVKSKYDKRCIALNAELSKQVAKGYIKMKEMIRLFISIWYLAGWTIHIYFGLYHPDIYSAFGQTALIPAFTQFWADFVMPRIPLFAILLAAFELVVGILLISKEKWVKIGLILSVAFNLFLIQLGLSFPTQNGLMDFLVNRLPNVIFICCQIPLFMVHYEIWLHKAIINRFRRSGRR